MIIFINIIQINFNEADHKPIITPFLSLFFVVAQEKYTSNANDKKLGNLEIKNYTNKFLERPESVWSVLRSSKSKKYIMVLMEEFLNMTELT